MKLTRLLMGLFISLLPACGPTPAPAAVTSQTPAPPAVNSLATVLPQAEETVIVNQNSATAPIITPTIAEPTKMTENQTALPPETEALIARAKDMLTQIPELKITAGDVSLAAVETRQWRDSSLDCPRPGMMYNQVITPGYLIILDANGKQYEFHTNTRETVVLCLIDGQDALKVLRP